MGNVGHLSILIYSLILVLTIVLIQRAFYLTRNNKDPLLTFKPWIVRDTEKIEVEKEYQNLG